MPNLTKYVINDNITYVIEKYWVKKMSLKWKISDICKISFSRKDTIFYGEEAGVYYHNQMPAAEM